jgi:hypothetical protein
VGEKTGHSGEKFVRLARKICAAGGSGKTNNGICVLARGPQGVVAAAGVEPPHARSCALGACAQDATAGPPGARQLGCAVGAEAREMGRGAGWAGAARQACWAAGARWRSRPRAGKLGWRSAGPREGMGAGAACCELGRDAVGRAGGGGEERGKGGGWAGRVGPGRGAGPLSFSFFLSLFYFFQFDIMRK